MSHLSQLHSLKADLRAELDRSSALFLADDYSLEEFVLAFYRVKCITARIDLLTAHYTKPLLPGSNLN